MPHTPSPIEELWRLLAFALAHVDDIGIGRRDADGADGFVVHVVEQRFPVEAAVGGLPQAAGGESDIHGHRILFGPLDIVDAAHHDGRSDGAEYESFEITDPTWDSAAAREAVRHPVLGPKPMFEK